MKKFKALSLIFFCFVLLPSSFCVEKDCYEKWLADFDAATAEYLENVDRCEGVDSENLCMMETDMRYDHQIDVAAQNYEDCL